MLAMDEIPSVLFVNVFAIADTNHQYHMMCVIDFTDCPVISDPKSNHPRKTALVLHRRCRVVNLPNQAFPPPLLRNTLSLPLF